MRNAGISSVFLYQLICQTIILRECDAVLGRCSTRVGGFMLGALVALASLIRESSAS